MVADEAQIPLATQETEAAIGWVKGSAHIPLPEETIEDSDARTVITRYTPIGVVGALVPWNFPLMLAAGKIAPALLTGNVIVLKPSLVTTASKPHFCLQLLNSKQSVYPLLRSQAR